MPIERTGWPIAVVTAIMLVLIVFISFGIWFVVRESAHGLGIGSLFITPAYAHDDWINRGGYKNKANQLCCGERDCHIVTNITKEVKGGFWVDGFVYFKDSSEYGFEVHELIPYRDAPPSEDDDYHLCGPTFGGNEAKFATIQRRCFFAPQNSF